MAVTHRTDAGAGDTRGLVRGRTLVACNGAHVLHDGLVDMLYALLPVLADAFGLSYAQVGMIRAANRTATASLQIPAGLAAERLGARVLLVGGTLFAGAALVALSSAESFVSILVFCLLLGCGGAVQHPLSSALITEAFTGDGRRRALGLYNAFGDVGKFAFLGVTVVAVGAGAGWQLPVAAFGAVSVVTAAAVWHLLRSAGVGARPAPGAHRATGSGLLGGWGIKSGKGVLSLGAIAALDSATRNGTLTFVAFVMIEKGVDPGWAGSAVLLTLFGGMCGKLACGMLAERVGIVRTIAITEIWTALGIAVVVLAPSYAAFAALPVLGIALNGTSSVIYGTVGELIDDARHARAYGVIYTLGSVCGIVAPLVYGATADLAGLSTMLLIVATVVLFTLPLLPVLSRALAAAGDG